MAEDLYKILGVRKNASRAKIKAAYQKRAMVTHPDRGGSEVAFNAVKRAFDVLSDDARRARYDATGEVDKATCGDPAQGRRVEILGQVLQQAVVGVVQAGRKLEHEDLVARMRTIVNDSIAAAQRPRDEAARMRPKLADAAERFEIKGGGENLLADMVRGQLAGLDREMAAADAQIAAWRDALEALKDYSYRRSPQAASDKDAELKRLLSGMMAGGPYTFK